MVLRSRGLHSACKTALPSPAAIAMLVSCRPLMWSPGKISPVRIGQTLWTFGSVTSRTTVTKPMGRPREETETATAPTRVAASSAVGLVDTVSFLLCREDCTNIEVSSKRRQTPKHTTLSTHWRKERSFSGLPTHCPLIGFLIHSPYIEFVIGHAMAESTSFPSSRWLVC